ncbi:PhzF family phenazine biosynthesis protein [Spongiibacter sp. KMU-158]|uniref:PhzF family phenazine biosynthesis protein n=1 Tax=Spongiibacter pelagi TaxID=2760804 RepID=A0A927GW30_9GAMM|nr:PhzF family phenazine biosynthesis protein [Spongiibacter pelagi]
MPYYIVDAFSDKPFAGNPAAICLQPAELNEAELQRIAAEFNLSETAFLRPLDEVGEHWSLRWFTPATEVKLCGHATLAAAHILWTECEIDAQQLRFETLSGQLCVRRLGVGYQLQFPLIETVSDQGDWAQGLAEEIRGTAVAGEDLLIELPTADQVKSFKAELLRIAQLPSRGLIVTAAGEAGVDFVSRFFAPQFGIDEDPVTGSAHCALAHYWSTKLGKSQFVAVQCSARGGELAVQIEGSLVLIAGNAVTVMAGQLYYPAA